MTDVPFRRAKMEALSPKWPSKDFADARDFDRITRLSASAVRLNKRSLYFGQHLGLCKEHPLLHLHVIWLETGLSHYHFIEIDLGRPMGNCDVGFIFALVHSSGADDS